jgi:TP901 family phage tail tape measure protein
MAGIRASIEANLDTSKVDMQFNKMMSRLSGKQINFNVNARSFTQPLGRITASANEFTKSLEASNARVVAFGASVGIINGVTNAFKGLVAETIKFEKTLADINVILNSSSSSIEKFGHSLFGVAKNTAQSFSKVADAALEFSRQGLSMEETLRRTNDALILTRLTSLKAEEAVSGLTAAINAFGEAGLTTTQIIDKLAAVDVKFAVSSEDLINALERTGAVAIDAGVELDNLIGLVTSLQQTTARGGSVIGNGLKTIFTRIQRPQSLEQLENMGIAVRDLAGAIIPADKILLNIAKTFDQLTQSQKSNVVQFSAGIFQANIFRSALRDLAKDQNIFSQASEVSAKAAGEAAVKNEQLNKTVAALASQSATAVSELAEAIGKLTLTPELGGMLETFLSAVTGIKDSLGGGEEEGSTFAKGLVRGIGNVLTGPALFAFGAVFIKMLTSVSKFAGQSLKDVLNITTKKEKIRQMEESIVGVLSQNKHIQEGLNDLEGDRLAQEKFLLKIIEAQTNAMAKQKALAGSLVGPLMRAGVSPDLTSRTPGPVDLDGDGVVTSASGFIPSRAQKRREIEGAIAGGYSPGSIKSMNMPGVGRVVYNTAEEVKSFPGMQQPAIMPPGSSSAGRNYKDRFMSQHGFDPYASHGFIPNFAQLTGSNLKFGKARLNLFGNSMDIAKAVGVNYQDIEKEFKKAKPSVLMSASLRDIIMASDSGKSKITGGETLFETFNALAGAGVETIQRRIGIRPIPPGRKGQGKLSQSEFAEQKTKNLLNREQVSSGHKGTHITTYDPRTRKGSNSFAVDIIAFGDQFPSQEVKSGKINPANIISKSLRMASDNELSTWMNNNKVSGGKKLDSKNLKSAKNLASKLGISGTGEGGTFSKDDAMQWGMSKGFVPNFVKERVLAGQKLEIKDGDSVAGRVAVAPPFIDHRLAGVDAIEKDQDLGEEATQVAVNYYKGKSGLKRLQETRVPGGQAAYGRGLFNDINLARNLVRKGLGIPDLRYVGIGEYATQLNAAQSGEKGIWHPSQEDHEKRKFFNFQADKLSGLNKVLTSGKRQKRRFSDEDIEAIRTGGVQSLMDRKFGGTKTKEAMEIFNSPNKNNAGGFVPNFHYWQKFLKWSKGPNGWGLRGDDFTLTDFTNYLQNHTDTNPQEIAKINKQAQGFKARASKDLKGLGGPSMGREGAKYYASKAAIKDRKGTIDLNGIFIKNLKDKVDKYNSGRSLGYFSDASSGLIPNFANVVPFNNTVPFKKKIIKSKNLMHQEYLRAYAEGENQFKPGQTMLQFLSQFYDRKTLRDLRRYPEDYRILSKGFVPNFANPLGDAIAREQAAGVAANSIRIEQSNQLKSSKNPLGLAVTNTRDEPNGVGQGIARSRRMGINPKEHGASRGLVPNFIAGAGIQKTFGKDIEASKLRTSLDQVTKKFNKLSKTVDTLTRSTTDASNAVEDHSGAQEEAMGADMEGLQKLFYLQSSLSMASGFLEEFAEGGNEAIKSLSEFGLAASNVVSVMLTAKEISSQLSSLGGFTSEKDRVSLLGGKGMSVGQGFSSVINDTMGSGGFLKGLKAAGKGLLRFAPVIGQVITGFTILNEAFKFFGDGKGIMDQFQSSSQKAAEKLEKLSESSELSSAALESVSREQDLQKKILSLEVKGKKRTLKEDAALTSNKIALLKAEQKRAESIQGLSQMNKKDAASQELYQQFLKESSNATQDVTKSLEKLSLGLANFSLVETLRKNLAENLESISDRGVGIKDKRELALGEITRFIQSSMSSGSLGITGMQGAEKSDLTMAVGSSQDIMESIKSRLQFKDDASRINFDSILREANNEIELDTKQIIALDKVLKEAVAKLDIKDEFKKIEQESTKLRASMKNRAASENLLIDINKIERDNRLKLLSADRDLEKSKQDILLGNNLLSKSLFVQAEANRSFVQATESLDAKEQDARDKYIQSLNTLDVKTFVSNKSPLEGLGTQDEKLKEFANRIDSIQKLNLGELEKSVNEFNESLPDGMEIKPTQESLDNIKNTFKDTEGSVQKQLIQIEKNRDSLNEEEKILSMLVARQQKVLSLTDDELAEYSKILATLKKSQIDVDGSRKIELKKQQKLNLELGIKQKTVEGAFALQKLIDEQGDLEEVILENLRGETANLSIINNALSGRISLLRQSREFEEKIVENLRQQARDTAESDLTTELTSQRKLSVLRGGSVGPNTSEIEANLRSSMQSRINTENANLGLSLEELKEKNKTLRNAEIRAQIASELVDTERITLENENLINAAKLKELIETNGLKDLAGERVKQETISLSTEALIAASKIKVLEESIKTQELQTKSRQLLEQSNKLTELKQARDAASIDQGLLDNLVGADINIDRFNKTRGNREAQSRFVQTGKSEDQLALAQSIVALKETSMEGAGALDHLRVKMAELAVSSEDTSAVISAGVDTFKSSLAQAFKDISTGDKGTGEALEGALLSTAGAVFDKITEQNIEKMTNQLLYAFTGVGSEEDAMKSATEANTRALVESKLSENSLKTAIESLTAEIQQRTVAEPEGFNNGGMVNGPPGIDKVLARLTAGEYVIPKKQVDKMQKFDKGGEVKDYFKDPRTLDGKKIDPDNPIPAKQSRMEALLEGGAQLATDTIASSYFGRKNRRPEDNSGMPTFDRGRLKTSGLGSTVDLGLDSSQLGSRYTAQNQTISEYGDYLLDLHQYNVDKNNDKVNQKINKYKGFASQVGGLVASTAASYAMDGIKFAGKKISAGGSKLIDYTSKAGGKLSKMGGAGKLAGSAVSGVGRVIGGFGEGIGGAIHGGKEGTFKGSMKSIWGGIKTAAGQDERFKKFNQGGAVPAMLTAGESVVPKSIASTIGYENLRYINKNGEFPTVAGPAGIDKVGPVPMTPGDFVVKKSSTQSLANKNPHLMRMAMQNPGVFKNGGVVRGYYNGGVIGEQSSPEPGVFNEGTGSPALGQSMGRKDSARGGQVTNNINVTVTVDQSGQEKVDTASSGDSYSKEQELSMKIKSAVLDVIREEKRVGGELS